MPLLEALRAELAGTYDVEREVGAGGMARVYLARDRKHDRQVALKVIDAQIAATLAAERFLREIRLCARLSHPNILPLLDSGCANTLPFYVMPFVSGESIRDRLVRGGPLAVDEAITLVREVADALDYAHAAGVLHRDVKPENVLLHGGHAVVLDFGVGRAMSAATEGPADLTQAGLVVGTPAYMSPEQAASELTTDGRSDEYSLAVMLYEMLTGATPFQAPTAQALIAKRFFETPAPVDTLRPEVPRHVSAALVRALAREPGDRFPTVGAFGQALGAAGPVTFTPPATARASDHLSIAVIPFANVGGNPDNAFVAEGITDEVIGALSRLRTLRVAARMSSYAVRDLAADAATIGARLNVAHLLEGSVRRAGSRIRVTARLVKVADGFQLWSDRFDRELDDVFAIQDAISEAIVTALKATILSDSAIHAAHVMPTNAVAYAKYLEGRFAWNLRTPAGFTRAADLFAAAIAADDGYAPACAGLADTYVMQGVYGLRDPRVVMPLARTSAERALSLDPALADAHAALGCVAAVHDHDWAASESAYARALTLEPSHVAARQFRASTLHVPRRRFADAIADADSARGLDPLSVSAAVTAGVARGYAGDYNGAIATFDEVLAAHPAFGMATFFTGTCLIGLGRYADARAAFERAITLVGDSPELFAWLVHARARDGDLAGAERDLAALVASRGTRYVAPTRIAQGYAALGDTSRALEWLGTAEVERDPNLVYINDPRAFAPLFAAPAFVALAGRLGLLLPAS